MRGFPRVNLVRLAREQWPYWCGILILPVITLFILAATLVTPGYSHTTDTISHLGGRGRPYPWVANTGIFLGGLLGLAFAYGLFLQFGKSLPGKVLSALLGVNAMALIFAVLFEVTRGEVRLEPSFLGATVHEVAARVGFTALIILMLLFPAAVWGRPQWKGTVWILQALAISAVVFGLLFVLDAFPSYNGAVERILFAMCGIWLEVVALQLYRTR